MLPNLVWRGENHPPDCFGLLLHLSMTLSPCHLLHPQFFYPAPLPFSTILSNSPAQPSFRPSVLLVVICSIDLPTA